MNQLNIYSRKEFNYFIWLSTIYEHYSHSQIVHSLSLNSINTFFRKLKQIYGDELQISYGVVQCSVKST